MLRSLAPIIFPAMKQSLCNSDSLYGYLQSACIKLSRFGQAIRVYKI